MDVLPGLMIDTVIMKHVGTKLIMLGLEGFTSHVIQDTIYLDMDVCFVLDIINLGHQSQLVKVISG